MDQRPPDAERLTSRIEVLAGRAPGTPRWVKAIAIGGLAAVALVVIVMLVAGGQHGPGRHLPGGGASPSGAASPAPATGSGTATDSVGAPADEDDATRTVEVDSLDTMTYEPSGITVAAGETVTFIVTNAGAAVHEFTLGDTAIQEEHAAQMEHMPEGMAHDQANSITVRPGETKQLTWRFGAAGTLEYACHEPGHYEAGMRGRITVT